MLLQKNTVSNSRIYIEEKLLLSENFNIVKVFGATPEDWKTILGEYFYPLYDKFTTILKQLQKYAYEETDWDHRKIARWIRKLTIEDIHSLFRLDSWNFISYLAHRSNPFAAKSIEQHINKIIHTTQETSVHIITDTAKEHIEDIANQLITIWASLTILLTQYIELVKLLPKVDEEFGPYVRTFFGSWGGYGGVKVEKLPSLENYDKRRDYYEDENPATLPTHYHVSDDMLELAQYLYDHQEN